MMVEEITKLLNNSRVEGYMYFVCSMLSEIALIRIGGVSNGYWVLG